MLPATSDPTNKIIKIKNKTLATPSTLAAIPANAKIPAMTAIVMKTTDQRNITKDLMFTINQYPRTAQSYHKQ